MATWSVVGKSKKKTQNQPLTKSQKKQFIEHMPRIEPLDPVKEDATIYDAFIQKEQQRYEKKLQEKFADKIEAGKEPNGKGISDGGAKKKQIKKKLMEQAPKKKPFEDGIKEISEADLKSVLLQSKGHFPDKPELWLKDLVTYLNMKLEHCPDTDKFLKKEHTDFPASLMKKGCAKVLTSVLGDCSATTLDHVLFFCFNTMLDELQNGNSTYGFKIFLQLVIRSSPDVVLMNLSQYRDLVKTNQNRPERCLMLMWALGQVGYPSLKAGIRVWLDIMQPYLGMKALNAYSLQYLKTLLSLHQKDLLQAGGEIQLREYFYLLDITYGQVLPADLRKEMKELHPQLKKIAQGKDLDTSLRNFFPSYLTRAKPDIEKDLKMEVLGSLMDCLVKDKHTYSLWIKLYTTHLTQSRVLLTHMSENFEAIRDKMDLTQLQQMLMTFTRTNEESFQGKTTADVDAVTDLCQELLQKMSKPRFPWKWVMFFLVSTVIAIVAYDVHSSKHLEDSRTVRFLEAYGILFVLQESWSWLSHYIEICFIWLTVNVPLIYKAVYTTVAPVVSRGVELVAQGWDSTGELRRSVADKIYSWAPDAWNEVGIFLTVCWDYILEYTYWIQGHLIVWYGGVCQWVDEHILHGDFSFENIKDQLSVFYETVWTTVSLSLQWCYKTGITVVNYCLQNTDTQQQPVHQREENGEKLFEEI